MKMSIYKIKLLNFLIRKGKVNKEEQPLDLKEAFSKFTNGGNHMSKEQLLRFMMEYQGEENCTLSDLEAIIIEKFLQVGSSSSIVDVSKWEGLSLHDFINFLLLDDFNGPLKNEVCFFYVCFIIENLWERNYSNVLWFFIIVSNLSLLITSCAMHHAFSGRYIF